MEGWGLDKEQCWVTFLVVLWLRLCPLNAEGEGLGWMSGQGTRSHMP